ncbi:MAG TPA: hypothetical protein VNO31_19225 [Umezawaea sp.]|nr:hypothetical protein [Umezawaea sp.]
MSSRLENRYRGLLRVVLPGWYRAEREEEMVGLFLADRTDDLDLEHGWPGWGETGATIALGARTRFAASGAPARAVMVGDAVRLIAMIGVLVQVAYAVQGAMSALLWWPPIEGGTRTGASPFTVLVLATDLTVLVAAVALVLGFRGAGKVLLALVAVLHLARLTGADPYTLPLSLFWQVPLWLTCTALLAGFHGDAPTPALGRWRWALAATVLGSAAVLGANVLLSPYVIVPLAAMAAVPAAAVVAGLVHLLRRGGGVGAIAIGVWLAALLPVELLYVFLSGANFGVLVAAMAATAAALLVVGLREIRRPAAAVTP